MFIAHKRYATILTDHHSEELMVAQVNSLTLKNPVKVPSQEVLLQKCKVCDTELPF